MSCSACTKTKPIPTCTQSLILGTVTPSTTFTILIKNLATGRVTAFIYPSDSEGVISIPLSDFPDSWYENQVFECKVVSMDLDTAPVTIGEDEYNCFQLTFTRINTTDGALSPESITLEII